MLGISLIVALLIFCLGILYYLYQGPLYIPTLAPVVQQMIDAAGIRPGMKVADLGSGDGRIVVAFAKLGVMAVGFEINPLLVWYSRYKIRRLGLDTHAQITTSNFWNKNLGEYDVVTVFGINHVMEKLGQKLLAELKPGAIVISNAFHVPGLTQVKQIGSLIVYKK